MYNSSHALEPPKKHRHTHASQSGRGIAAVTIFKGIAVLTSSNIDSVARIHERGGAAIVTV